MIPVASRRERSKNKREEFHRRVATPIEGGLAAFEGFTMILPIWR
jgi:hypothetical protein